MADKILSIADGLHDELPSTTTAKAGRILITTDRGEMYYEPEDKKRIQINPQADWQQNDETANDYIKNRPGGYIDNNNTIVKIPEKYLDIKNTNIVNGSKAGSLRTVGSSEESSEYTIGTCAFAEGDSTKASGDYSHAEGYETKASGDHQHVQGKYNIGDSSNIYADIIGNGSFDTRSNAATVDWQGNAWYAGEVYVGSTSGTNRDEGSKKLATEEYIDTQIGDINTALDSIIEMQNSLIGGN